MRVRLNTNLQRYDARLTAGQEGSTTEGRTGLGDRFVNVRFDCGAFLPILWQSLEVLEEPKTATL